MGAYFYTRYSNLGEVSKYGCCLEKVAPKVVKDISKIPRLVWKTGFTCLSNATLFTLNIPRQASLLLGKKFTFLWQCNPGYKISLSVVLCLFWIRSSIPRTELSYNSFFPAFTQSTPSPKKKKGHPWYFLLFPALHFRNEVRSNTWIFLYYMYKDWFCHKQEFSVSIPGS